MFYMCTGVSEKWVDEHCTKRNTCWIIRINYKLNVLKMCGCYDILVILNSFHIDNDLKKLLCFGVCGWGFNMLKITEKQTKGNIK